MGGEGGVHHGRGRRIARFALALAELDDIAGVELGSLGRRIQDRVELRDLGGLGFRDGECCRCQAYAFGGDQNAVGQGFGGEFVWVDFVWVDFVWVDFVWVDFVGGAEQGGILSGLRFRDVGRLRGS
jgi:hypothetical protein